MPTAADVRGPGLEWINGAGEPVRNMRSHDSMGPDRVIPLADPAAGVELLGGHHAMLVTAEQARTLAGKAVAVPTGFPAGYKTYLVRAVGYQSYPTPFDWIDRENDVVTIRVEIVTGSPLLKMPVLVITGGDIAEVRLVFVRGV